MKPSRQRRGFFAALVACMAFAMIAAFITPAAAEQKERKPRTLLELLLGNRKAKEKPQATKKSSAPARQRTTTSAKPAPEIPDKLENARVVLVFGDFNAGSLASGLEDAFETSPGIVIESRVKGSSGLVRQDYYDWVGELPAILDEVKPTIAVISIGGNDRQDINIGSVEYQFRSSEWVTQYEQRIQSIINITHQRNIPLLWAGLPSFRSPSFAADMITLNSLYREAADKGNATYVDLWDGFVDEEGKFTFSGSDIDGQQVRLRTSDGLGFTSAGKRKQAYYVERHIRRLMGDVANPAFSEIPESNLTELTYFPPINDQQLVRTEPISITDPALDGGDNLLGGPTPPLPPASPLNRLMKDGYTGPETAGRADYYSPEAEQLQ